MSSKFALSEHLRTGVCQITGKPYNCARCDEGKKKGPTGKGNIRTLHVNMSISGAMRRDGEQEWNRLAGIMQYEDGRKLAPKDVRAYFHELHALGADALPMCECDNFCYRHGCRGHREEGEL